MKTEWKTGRIYDFPQVIVAVMDTDGIAFHDASRGISGTIALPAGYPIDTPAKLQSHVMRSYDSGAYRATSTPSWAA
jgi:hypothetical protein